MTTPNHVGRRRPVAPGGERDASPTPAGSPVPDRSTATEAEAALLGAALYNPHHAAQVLGDLTPDDLADPGHRAVLAAIRAVLADGAPPDPALVLAAYNRGQHYGSPAHLFALTIHHCLAAAGTPGTEGHYRRAVLEARWRRDAITAAHRIHQAANTAPLADLHAVLAEVLAGLGSTLARIALTPAPTPTRRGQLVTTAAPAAETSVREAA
jgi:replicative DNA helicase